MNVGQTEKQHLRLVHPRAQLAHDSLDVVLTLASRSPLLDGLDQRGAYDHAGRVRCRSACLVARIDPKADDNRSPQLFGEVPGSKPRVAGVVDLAPGDPGDGNVADKRRGPAL